MKRILVPFDFSASAKNAAEYAVSLATAFRADVCLLHVYTEPVTAIEDGGSTVMFAAQLKKKLNANLNEEKSLLEKQLGRKIETRLLEGFKSDVIGEMAESWHADLVVMGRNTAKNKVLFGSTILKTIRKTTIPLLVVPGDCAYKTPKNIVLAIDFEEMVYHPVIGALTEIVKQFDAALSVLHVDSREAMPAGEIDEKLQWGRTMAKLTYTYERVENENIEQGIVKFITNHPADMLVMIAHRHNLLQRLFSRIHTQSLAFDVNIPLLVLRN